MCSDTHRVTPKKNGSRLVHDVAWDCRVPFGGPAVREISIGVRVCHNSPSPTMTVAGERYLYLWHAIPTDPP